MSGNWNASDHAASADIGRPFPYSMFPCIRICILYEYRLNSDLSSEVLYTQVMWSRHSRAIGHRVRGNPHTIFLTVKYLRQ